MLVLSRLLNEKVIVGLPGNETMQVEVLEIRGDKVRLGFTAPKRIRIYREEIWDAIEKGEGPRRHN